MPQPKGRQDRSVVVHNPNLERYYNNGMVVTYNNGKGFQKSKNVFEGIQILILPCCDTWSLQWLPI